MACTLKRPWGAFPRWRRESEGGSGEGRLPGARGVGSPTGGWKPPLLQPTSASDNSEMPPHDDCGDSCWIFPTTPTDSTT